jgi:hypothetical protein
MKARAQLESATYSLRIPALSKLTRIKNTVSAAHEIFRRICPISSRPSRA